MTYGGPLRSALLFFTTFYYFLASAGSCRQLLARAGRPSFQPIFASIPTPAEGFNNGVEVTQITGITDSGELAGFYTDAHGAAHSFIACPAYAFCPNFPYVLPNLDSDR